MRLGVCADLERINDVENTGYEFIEPKVSTIVQLSGEEFSEAVKMVEDSSIKAEVCNVFFPPEIKLVGESVDYVVIKDYLLKAIDRISQIGTKVIVFGSAGARKVPEQFSKDKAFGQLIKLLHMASDIIRPYNITIVIEPLPIRACNIINDVLEGLELAKQVNRDNVLLLADFYHVLYDGEDLNNIVIAGNKYIKHIHVNNAKTATFPKLGDEINYYELFEPLRKINYKERISIEAKSDNFKNDLVESMDLWKTIFDRGW